MTDLTWQDQAACRDADPDVFFPADGVNSFEARRICNTCPVSEECLDYVMTAMPFEQGVYGVWGGTSGFQRRKLRARQVA